MLFRARRSLNFGSEPGLREEVIGIGVHEYGARGPGKRFLMIDVVLQAVVRGLVPALPGKTGFAAQLVAQTGQYGIVCIGAQMEGEFAIGPLKRAGSSVRRQLVERIGQVFVEMIGWRRCDGYAQYILTRIVGETAPGGGILREDQHGFILLRQQV